MAEEHDLDQGKAKVISLNRQEAADVVGLLVAQLADAALINNHAGACPVVNVVEDGKIKYRLFLVLK